MEREKKLTNISAWKQLGEGDLQQYVGDASSDENEGAVDQRKKRWVTDVFNLVSHKSCSCIILRLHSLFYVIVGRQG